MSEIAVDKTAFPAFQLQRVFEEKIDEHTEPEESHPGIISETSDGRKQKAGAIAGPYANWGWAFSRQQNSAYHEESRELVQAIEQYGRVQVGNRVYSLGGRDKNLLNFKEA